MHPSLPSLTAAVLAVGLTVTGCGSPTGPEKPSGAAPSSAFPMTITNCGVEVTLDRAPERVLLLKSAPVQYLSDLGVMDRVVARAGAYPRGYYDDTTWAEIESIPSLSDDLDPAGHLQVSKEVALAQQPDLVLGTTDNLDHETLGALGIPVLEEPALCSNGSEQGTPSFQTVADQFETYGRVFGVPEKGAEQAATFLDEVARVTGRVAPGDDGPRTAAVLYPTVGGGTTYAYGTGSMAHPQLEAAGLENVFADVEDRVFEVTAEELIGRNPDVLVLIHSDGDPAEVKKAVTELKGASALTAVREDAVVVQLFNFTEPPSPLAVDGLATIVQAFTSGSDQ